MNKTDRDEKPDGKFDIDSSTAVLMKPVKERLLVLLLRGFCEVQDLPHHRLVKRKVLRQGVPQ